MGVLHRGGNTWETLGGCRYVAGLPLLIRGDRHTNRQTDRQTDRQWDSSIALGFVVEA